MAKKKPPDGAATLSSFWCPPTNVLDVVGDPVACLSSTFEFDAAFFESELLPRFLGLKFDHTENEPTFLIEREEALALTATAVLVDIHKVDPAQTTLRWDQLPIAVPGSQSIQHSKIVILAWQNLIRLIVSSANLTRSGYRRNREVFAALDFHDHEESLPRGPVEDALELLEKMLAWSRVPPATRERTRSTLSLVSEQLSGWNAIPSEFRPRHKPKCRFVATHPATNRQGSASALDQLVSLWGSRTAKRITVYTPFVGKPESDKDKVIDRLATISRSRDCEGWLVAPCHPADEHDRVDRVALPKAFGNAWHHHFESRGGAHVLAIPQFIDGLDKVRRMFHSKLVAIENDTHDLIMIGSSNFTPHGMGVGVFNVEANLLFEGAGDDAWNRTNPPLSWDDWNAVDDIEWDDQLGPAEDCIDHAQMLPPFFEYASYSQVSGELRIHLNHLQPEPTDWTIRLHGPGAGEPPIFSRSLNSDEGVRVHTFPEPSSPVNLAALLVQWIDDEGQSRQARLILSIESKEDLVTIAQLQAFGVDAMLDCLIYGRSLADWQERQSNRKVLGLPTNSALDSLRSIDTSGYMLYQVRRFGRAMWGLRERLERVVLAPAAVRYRLFKDPLGPVSLAEALTSTSGTLTGAYAALSDDQRLFLLAELLLAVAHTMGRILKRTDKKTRNWLSQVVSEAIATLAALVTERRDTLGASLPGNMKQYVSAAIHEATDLIGETPREAVHAS